MSKSNQAGKGDKYRPVNKAKYDANYDAIFRKKSISNDERIKQLTLEYNQLPRKDSFSGLAILEEIEKLQNN